MQYEHGGDTCLKPVDYAFRKPRGQRRHRNLRGLGHRYLLMIVIMVMMVVMMAGWVFHLVFAGGAKARFFSD